MKRLLLISVFACAFLASGLLFADDADKLTGKWTVKKTGDQGNFTQNLEIKKDKFIFEILGADGNAALHAEGDVKFEKSGPFNVAHFLHIKAGLSATELQDVAEERKNVYVIDGDNWLMASNFEEDRDQKPTLDVYKRAKSSAGSTGGGTLVIDEVQMTATPQSATWYFCIEFKLGDATRRYYVENKGYDKSQVTIPVALELPKAQAGQKVTFKMQLDDIDGDACSDEPDNRSTGEFAVSERGSQSFKPENEWSYTIKWHLK